MSKRPSARMEVDERSEWRGPLRLIAFGCLLTFLIGATIFAVVSGRDTGDPSPEGDSLLPVESP